MVAFARNEYGEAIGFYKPQKQKITEEY